MIKKVNYTIVDNPNNKPSEMQCVQLCLDELSAVGMTFPRNMKPGEKKVLLRNEDVKITLRCDEPNTYQFFYRSISNGCGTTFSSAMFKVENS